MSRNMKDTMITYRLISDPIDAPGAWSVGVSMSLSP